MRGGVAIAGWKGFTLVEMLVVLLIMGLTVGLISANVAPDDRELVRIEAERLAQLLSLAESDSRLSGASLGWTSDGSSYRFWRIDDNGVWSSVD
ncbi:MAG: prepilin-type N-terminal cleavage/methylation domain-containing protein, partial [Burkholderiales bacterium]